MSVLFASNKYRIPCEPFTTFFVSYLVSDSHAACVLAAVDQCRSACMLSKHIIVSDTTEPEAC